MTALLEASGVGRRYGDYVALKGASIAVRTGELVAVIGPNGAGKTTFVNVLTGLLAPSSGTVRFLGQDIAGLGPVRLSRMGLARAFQLVQVFPALSVRETLRLAALARLGFAQKMLAHAAGFGAAEAAAEEAAAAFGLSRRLDQPAADLSQGEKKLLDVASAFALRPRVILLDEPTSGVASADKRQVMDTVRDAAARLGVEAVLLVEHDMDLVEAYATRVVGIRGGEIIADLPTEKFFADEEACAALVGRRLRH
jgi:branched-chain amino acid transport system ATP-binding protein